MMRIGLACVVLVAGCGKKDDYKDPPPSPFDASPAIDAAPGPQMTARACVLMDARQLDSCMPTGVPMLHLKATLGTDTVDVAGDDGSFEIAQQDATGLVWKIESTTTVTSYMPANEPPIIPVLSRDKFAEMKSMSSVAVQIDLRGSIIAQMSVNGSGVVGETSTLPMSKYRLYDGDSDTAWQTTATQSHGTIWLAGVTATDNATLTLVHPPFNRPGLVVRIDAITFTTIIP